LEPDFSCDRSDSVARNSPNIKITTRAIDLKSLFLISNFPSAISLYPPSHSHLALGVCRKNGFSRRNLSDLCVSALNSHAKTAHRRDAENAENAQSSFFRQTPEARCEREGDAERLLFSHAKVIVAQRLNSPLLIYAIQG